MWTAKQANRVADRWMLLFPLLLLAMGVGNAVDGDWVAAVVLSLGAVPVYLDGRRRARRWDDEARTHGETNERALRNGRAGDEREAYIQLLAWAHVGQAALVLAFLLFAVGAALAQVNLLWIVASAPMLVLTLVRGVSVKVVRQRS